MVAARRRGGLAALVLLLALGHVGAAAAGAPTARDGTAPGAVATATASGAQVAATATVAAGATRLPPVPGEPVRPFEAPPHEYGPGHRGVDLPASRGLQVLAPAAGTVTFAGPVAGRGVVVLQHADGTLTSLEPVEAVVPRGSPVEAGTVVAVVTTGPPHAGCVDGCLHWGVRVAGRYVDPWWWLGRTRHVRLLPWSPSPFELPATARRGALPRPGPEPGIALSDVLAPQPGALPPDARPSSARRPGTRWVSAR